VLLYKKKRVEEEEKKFTSLFPIPEHCRTAFVLSAEISPNLQHADLPGQGRHNETTSTRPIFHHRQITPDFSD
jgi:hypothetical protein